MRAYEMRSSLRWLSCAAVGSVLCLQLVSAFIPAAVPTKACHKAATRLSAAVVKDSVVKPWLTTAQETVDAKNVEAMYVRHILVQSEELAITILDQVKKGADFAELAKTISDCEGTRSKGGEIGWVSSADTHLDDIIALAAREACLKYKPGDVHMITTDRGVHLIKVIVLQLCIAIV
jgi:parvulin-like peptidyl-prolyl isomerase